MEKSRSNSVFTNEQEIFIVEEFARNPSPKGVKNAFLKKYRSQMGPATISKISPKSFVCVRDRFQKNGIATISPKIVPHNKGDVCTDEEKIMKIENFFIENPMSSINEAVQEFEFEGSPIPYETIRRILKKNIKMKPYKPYVAQHLTETHKKQRLEFCQWLLEQDEEIIHQIIWGDEKWFHLTQHPNKQNVRFWSVQNPFFVNDSKQQGCQKIMAFVCVFNGGIFPVIWHIDEEGKHVSVNTNNYIKVLKDEIFPWIPQELLDEEKVWWMQDGAPSHTSNASMSELKKVFGDKIISRFASKFGGIEWPSHSPDLNPLDYSFWSQAQREVWKNKPDTIEDLKLIVEEFFESLDQEKVRKTVSNILKRAQLCVEEKGGHFEHKLKYN